MPRLESRPISVTSHGRYVARPGTPGAPMLVGFHGYAESADTQMARLAAVPRLDAWTLVSVQGLHRFYRGRSEDVVASWMTRQDRELTIADNVEYVAAVLDQMCRESGTRPPVVFAGFSQGVAMAFRAACLGPHAPSAIVALGGDVPPELGPEALARAPRVLLGRGRDDRWYTEEMLAIDVARLAAAGVPVERFVGDGGHEWNTAFAEAVSAFLETGKMDQGPRPKEQGPTIRPATPDDAHRLAELRWDFRSGLSSPVEPRTAFVERCAAWMRDEIASGRWHAWVAARRGDLVGQLWLYVIDKLPNPVAEPARHAYISNLFVAADARGGVGTALLEAAIAYARAQHVDRIVLWPTARSRSLYQRYGFTAAGDVFEKRL